MTLDLAVISWIEHQRHRLKKKKKKKKIAKIGILKIKENYAPKDIINRIKMHPTEWVKIFANHISNKGLISRICRELLKLNNKNNPSQTWAKEFLQRKLYEWPIST